jgi:hypothetical protein
MKNNWFKNFFAPWRLCVKTKGMEARTCPRCHSQVTYPPPGGTGRCPHCDCLLIGDPTPADLEMLRDDMAGQPLPRKAVVGIADMQARLQQLTQEKKQLLDRLQDGAAADHPGWDSIAELNRQIQEATDRLAEYQVQQQGLN